MSCPYVSHDSTVFAAPLSLRCHLPSSPSSGSGGSWGSCLRRRPTTSLRVRVDLVTVAVSLMNLVVTAPV